MADKEKKMWSYSAGERGRNRVRVYEDGPGGMLFLEFTNVTEREGARRKRIALGHKDREAAKVRADIAAAKLGQHVPPPTGDLTLGRLFALYLGEATPNKSESKQKHDERAAKLFLEAFKPDRKVKTLNVRDWDSFIMRRRTGQLVPQGSQKGKSLRGRTINYDLKFLVSALNWAELARDDNGHPLIERNPLRKLVPAPEESPRQPAISESEYPAFLEAARKIGPLCELAVILAEGTGHRRNSIAHLRWSDINFEDRTIHWAGEWNKQRYETISPMGDTVFAALRAARARQAAIGDSFVFPSPRDPMKPASRNLFRDWWEKIQELSGLPPVRGRGWHSFRRKFVQELKNEVSTVDLAYLGGWKSPATVTKVYMKADTATLRRAVEIRDAKARGRTEARESTG